MEPIHDLMPVILKPDDYDLWLDPEVNDPDMSNAVDRVK